MNTEQRPGIALITGGTGFIGSNLVKKLISQNWNVHVVIRPSSHLTVLNGLEKDISLHTYDGSIESLLKIFEVCQPDIVFHLASLFLAQHNPQDIAPMIHSNLTFATQLVDAMVTYKVYKLINTGTSWQHFENKDYSPVCLYAATKQAFEAILQFYLETTPLKVITLKLFDSYGKDDPRQKLFTLLEKIYTSQEPLLMSPGEQKINLVYIDDIIDAYIIAAKRLQLKLNNSHESYAIGSTISITLREIVSTYEQEIGKQLPIIWGGRPYRDREVMRPWNKGNNLSEWQPATNLRTGIKKCLKII